MALYAYGVVESTHAVDTAGLETVDAGSLRAVAREVNVADFEGERLEQHLGDPAWLESAVREHEAVVEQLLRGGPVVPMQFGSIFSTADALASMLDANASMLVSLLDRVRDRDEWGVRLAVDARRAAKAVVSAGRAEGGRAYLERRRDEQRAVDVVLQAAGDAASAVHLRLAAASDDATTLTIRKGSGSSPEVLHGAYLVPRAGSDAFLAAVDAIRADLGSVYDLAVTGPWPPYSFTTVDVTGPR